MNTKHKMPDELRRLVRGYRWRRIDIGESGADVYRLEDVRRPPLFLKYSRGNTYLCLRDEAARLRWLAGRVTVPEVLASAAEGDREWLLMTALAGTNAAAARAPVSVKVRVVAHALRTLHAIDASTCPFDESLDTKIARAADNVRQDLVETAHFDEENLGRSAAGLFSEMLSKRPAFEDLVVTHGDACLPNVMLDGNRFSGFVDCTRAGRADRYQDLALACRSIEGDLGAQWVAPFLRHYDPDPIDRERLAFYRLLDEFS